MPTGKKMKCMFCRQDLERVRHNDEKVHTYRCPNCHYLIDISAKDDITAQTIQQGKSDGQSNAQSNQSGIKKS